VRCSEGGNAACPEAASTCVVPVGDVDASDIENACAVSLVPGRLVSRFVCSDEL
jgi:hypothetical protein